MWINEGIFIILISTTTTAFFYVPVGCFISFHRFTLLFHSYVLVNRVIAIMVPILWMRELRLKKQE